MPAPNRFLLLAALLLAAQNIFAQTVTVTSGGKVTLQNGGQIGVAGAFVVEGDFATDGTTTTRFENAGDHTLTAPAALSLDNVVVDKPSGDLVLGVGLFVSGVLEVSGGGVNLNGHTIDLGTTGTLQESAGNTVYGTSGFINARRTLNAPDQINVAGLGAEITSSKDLGLTIVRRGHAVQTVDGQESIARFFDITPTTNFRLNATLRFHYDDSELNGITEADLLAFRSTNNGANWTEEGGAPAGRLVNAIEVTGIDAFSRWTLAAAAPAFLALAGQVFLQGPYDPASGQMRTALRDGDHLPTSQPYADPAYDGSPLDYDGNEANASPPADAVDWVLVELRTGTDASTEAATAAAFLLADGSIVEAGGVGPVTFPSVPTGSYYVVVRHRNHLAVMSAAAVDCSSGACSYDFTTAQAQAHSNGAEAMADLGAGAYGLIAADADADGDIDTDDFLAWYAAFGAGPAYLPTDLDLDGDADTDDFLAWYPTFGGASQVPD